MLLFLFLLQIQVLSASKVTFFIDSLCKTPSSFSDAIIDINACNSFSNQPNISLRFGCDSSQASIQIYLSSSVCRGSGSSFSTINYPKDTCATVTVGTELFYIYSDCAGKYGQSGYLGPNNPTASTTSTTSPTSKAFTSDSSSTSSSLSTGAIIGIIIAMIVVVILSLLAYKFYLKRKEQPVEPKIVYLGNTSPSEHTLPGPYPSPTISNSYSEQVYHNELAEEYPINGYVNGYQNYGYEYPNGYGQVQGSQVLYNQNLVGQGQLQASDNSLVDSQGQVPSLVGNQGQVPPLVGNQGQLPPLNINVGGQGQVPPLNALGGQEQVPPLNQNVVGTSIDRSGSRNESINASSTGHRDSILSTPVSIPLE